MLHSSVGSSSSAVTPLTGRCFVEVKFSDACHPCPDGTLYCAVRALMPAIGCDATCCASASSGCGRVDSICGAVCGTARPKMREKRPKIDDCRLSEKDARMLSR